MRLTLVISTLDSGGAERVMSTLANHWAERGHQVTLITLAGSVPDFYRVSSKVHRIRLTAENASIPTRSVGRLQHQLTILFSLRRAIADSAPHAVVSFIDITNILTLLVTSRMKVPVIISERVDPRAHWIPIQWRMLRRALYPRASALVVQTASVSNWASSMVGAKKIHVIANPLSVRHFAGPASIEVPAAPFALAVGRLVPQKGLDILIKAFALCSRIHPDWYLVILGKGPEEENLRHLAKISGVESRVHFLGATEDVEPFYRAGSLFVLPSRFEGFPNALLEAMAAGMPVIATDCLSGPREIIRDGVDGILVDPDDIENLSSAMERLMSDDVLSARLAEQARRVNEQFSLEAIANRWEVLFSSVMDASGF